ncbi:MAG: segregation/condensation protein A [Sneathiella sp.]|nr:MAG: segregation/condensation protein A [Sneathiella sp.]
MVDKGSFDNAAQVNPDVIPLPTNSLVVDLDGYEGPLDVLLVLARDQKVDLLKISILELAEQFMQFVEQVQKLKLEVAADYLVMAAWLAYLKSRLLLPAQEDEGPTGEELADRLAFQLRKLEAMRGAVEKMMNGTIVGRDQLRRGQPEGVRIIRHSKYECSLRDLLQAYADQKTRKGITNPLRLMRDAIFSVEAALERLEKMLGKLPEWTDLMSFLPENLTDPFRHRSAQASTLLAGLQMAKEGQLELRQSNAFGPIEVKKRKSGK